MPPSKHEPPPVQLRRVLERAREHGLTFDQGWYRAMGSRHPTAVKFPHDTPARREWRTALDATKAEWRAAFDLKPTRVGGHIDALRSHFDTEGADAFDLSGEIAA